MSERDAERSVSQTVRAQLALRDMILSGRLRPGERISELQAVDITGVARTPVRLGLVRLQAEGLVRGRAADPGDRPRPGATIRSPQRVCNGAVGTAGGAPYLAAWAGSSPHRGRRDREPRRGAPGSRGARAFPPRRAQSAAGD